MKKALSLLLAVVAVAPLSAQVHHHPLSQKHKTIKHIPSQLSFLKAGAVVKPLKGKEYRVLNHPGTVYEDSTAFETSYNTNGEILSETYRDLETLDNRAKRESTYDHKGIQTSFAYSSWDGTGFKLYSKDVFETEYDVQDRLKSVKEYSIDMDGDTVYVWNYSVRYTTDSILITAINKESDAPNGVVLDYRYWKPAGTQLFVNASLKDWYDTEYEMINLSAIDWNGVFSVERSLYLLGDPYLFDYADFSISYAGDVFTGRVVGTFSPIVAKEAVDEKLGLIYRPSSLDQTEWDSHGNETLYDYFEQYNVVTQQFESDYGTKKEYVYQQDNVLRMIHSSKASNDPTYYPEYMRVYSDFQDVSGISATNRIQNLNFYPNPSSGIIKAKIDGEVKSVNCTDMLGRTVELQFEIKDGQVATSVKDIRQGVYVVTIQTKTGVITGVVEVTH